MKTRIEPSKFAAITSSTGARSLEQSGYTKVGNFENGLFVYPNNGKTVTACTISGFTVEEIDGVISSSRGGSVKQELDFSRDEATVLAAYEAVVAFMLVQPKAEKPKRVSPMANKKEAAEKLANHVPSVPKTAEDKKARLAEIKRIADSMGVPVSPKTLAQYEEPMALCADEDGEEADYHHSDGGIA